MGRIYSVACMIIIFTMHSVECIDHWAKNVSRECIMALLQRYNYMHFIYINYLSCFSSACNIGYFCRIMYVSYAVPTGGHAACVKCYHSHRWTHHEYTTSRFNTIATHYYKLSEPNK